MHAIRRILIVLFIFSITKSPVPRADAATMIGDPFTVWILENAVFRDEGSGIAGSPGVDLHLTHHVDAQFDSYDGATLQFDLAPFAGSLASLTFVLRDFDFREGAVRREIASVTEAMIENGWSHGHFVGPRGMTIQFPTLDAMQAALGERIQFEFATIPAEGIDGDRFGVAVFEGGVQRDSAVGVAGEPSPDVELSQFIPCRVDWHDAFTFELRFSSSLNRPLTNLEIRIDDLDFQRNGVLQDIVAVTELSSRNENPYVLASAKAQIIIVFTQLDVAAAAAGDVITFRIDTEGHALLGDLNCDGSITVSDIGPFVTALVDPEGYGVAQPDCNSANADTNQDTAVSPSDIGPFVALLIGQ
ncbi:MAG: hypothetical protein AB7N71_04575 [Phycisphaerae bacterium]